MSSKEKIGVAVIIGLFLVFGLILFLTIESPGGTGSFENNVIIDQRVRNLEKSR
ncbi:MAG: hypothetical protein KF886_10865 [Candidatus Hydrogenedentes bacterium]|nr:hypothetical protein [Candidatus Hydrogenedentota bacterium]